MAKEEVDLCLRCGECCRVKEWDATHSVFLRSAQACPHLRYNWDGLFWCDTYQNRPDTVQLKDGKSLKCTSAREAGKDGLLPPYCPYAREIPNYKTRVDNYVDYERFPAEVLEMSKSLKSKKHKDNCKYRYIIKGK